MQSAQHAFGAAAVVVLHELVVAAGGFVESFLVETLEEEASGIAEHLGLDQYDLCNSQWGRFHQYTFSFNSRCRYWP